MLRLVFAHAVWLLAVGVIVRGQVFPKPPMAMETLNRNLQGILSMNSAAHTLRHSDTPVGLSLGVALPEQVTAAYDPSDSVIALGGGFRKKGKPTQNAKRALCVIGNSELKALDDICVTPSDKFAMGSTAKMYTAAAVLRLVDQGKFGLDDKALPLFDALWTKLNGTSISKYMGPLIEEVTVRQLLAMQSGVPDFDQSPSRQYQFDHPQEDLGPVKEMSFLLPLANFTCQPGTCVEYSSSNYELLGLLLAQQAGKQSWDEYTQAEDLPILPEMTGTSFAVHGLCSEYTKVHAYSDERTPEVDVYDVSCTNGWTCGNLISTAADAAIFVKALLGGGERVVKEKTKQEMLKFKPLDKTWALGLPYGLGLMDLSWFMKMAPGELVGHAGETYGFNSLTMYSKQYDFGLSITANSENLNITTAVIVEAYTEIVKYINASKTTTLMV